MARKRKVTKKSSNLMIKLIIGFLIAYALLALIVFDFGAVGTLLSSVSRYIIGDYFKYLLGLLLIIITVYIIKNKSLKYKKRHIFSVVFILIGILIIQSSFRYKELSGWAIVTDYFENTSKIFSGELLAGGGLIGALLYGLFSYLFDYMGTVIVAIVLIVIGLILLIDFNMVVNYIKNRKKKVKKSEPVRVHNEDIYIDDEVVEDTSKSKKSTFINVTKDEPKSDKITITPPPVQEKKIETSSAIRTDSTGVIKTFTNYKLPDLNILDKVDVKNKGNSNNIEAAKTKGKKLIDILSEFNIPATLISTHIGPSVTKFEVRPDSSVRVNRIASISDNIKMELAAKDIRIEAPIPGRNAIGVEIPNVETTPVRMYELMKSIPSNFASKRLLLALGKDLMGQTIFCELDKMPHLLIAGSTGSGKSVCINSIISTILLRTSPHEVKLVLIDPKKVEFTQFNSVPHLMSPIISDVADANRTLKRIVEMMENRYNKFAEVGVRNIAGYNEYVANNSDKQLPLFPWIVVIIDELADLMAISGKDVEVSIQRITQLARAAGIHLIVATQRPSTDVITGTIKTNIPSRIAFAVSSGTDSRIILDQTGAERLLGNGDMLYFPIGQPAAVRLQGVYMSDDEINRIADFTSSQMKPSYDDAFFNLNDEETDGDSELLNNFNDALYEEVKAYVIFEQKASTSLLQRRFGIGYNRAARLIDALEAKGIIGPVQGSKPRDVYVKPDNDEY